MIDSSMRVLVSENGTEIEIAALEIGQRIIDPLSGVEREVIDLKIRRQFFAKGDNSHRLLPVSIPARQLGADGKPHNILVSKLQPILFPEEFTRPGKPRFVREVQAQSLVGQYDIRIESGVSAISYAAIFLDYPGFMAISGLVFKSYDLQSFRNTQALERHSGVTPLVNSSWRRYVN